MVQPEALAVGLGVEDACVGLGITVFSTWCLMGTGQLKSILRLTFATSVLDVVATIIFTKKFGLIGLSVLRDIPNELMLYSHNQKDLELIDR